MAKKQRAHGQGTLFKRSDDGPWIAQFFNHKGKRKERSTRTTDKRAAERIVAKFVTDEAMRRTGTVDAQLEAITDQSKRTIDSHLADYRAKLSASGRTVKHIKTQENYIRAVAEDNGWSIVSEINADGVNRYAGKLKDQRASAQTIRNQLTAIKGFCRWLARNHKLVRDPLMSISMPNPKADRRRERRMLLPQEWDWLKSITEASEPHHGLSGPERVLLYATAVQTGLRSSELRSLTRGRLSLDGEKPYIICKAHSTKNRKDARQYIQPELAVALREQVATKSPQAPVFSMPPEYEVADMLREDLAAARVAWCDAAKIDPDEYDRRPKTDFLVAVNDEGERLDFHALRHTCGAWLAMAGAHPKAVQAVMRHSTITLTMDTYGHLFPGQEADTVARLPTMLPEPKPQPLRATGTTDTSPVVAAHPQQYPQQLGLGTERRSSGPCVNSAACDAETAAPKSLRTAELGESVRDRSDSCGKSHRPDSNRRPAVYKTAALPTELRWRRM